MSETAYTMIHDLVVNKRLSPNAAADEVIEHPELARLVYPLLVAHARVCERATNRGQERVAETNLRSTNSESRATARRQLIDTRFPTTEGEFVFWLDATAEQHLERAAVQRLMAAGCVRDAENHEEAARQITEAGVTCLRDLGVTVAVEDEVEVAVA